MALTPDQIQTLSTDIQNNTDPVIVAALAAGDNNAIRDWYNGEASPAVVVWKTAVSVADANNAIDWTEYMTVPVLGDDNTAGLKLAMEQNTSFSRQNMALAQLFSNGNQSSGTFNPSLQTIRDALNEIFAGDPNTRAALLVLSKRNATYAEALYVGAPVQGAAVMAFEGNISLQDVRDAVALIP